PHARFIEMLTYKAALVGIQVRVTEESYTSKASFLDADPLPDYDAARLDLPRFSGKRVKRGLYRAANGTPINAEVNGAYNIIRKGAPEAFAQGSRGCVVHPMRLAACTNQEFARDWKLYPNAGWSGRDRRRITRASAEGALDEGGDEALTRPHPIF